MQFQVISTVSSPAASYDLTTLAIIREEVGIKNNASDARLQRYLTQASYALAQACNRVFLPEAILDEFWPSPEVRASLTGGAQLLQLSRWPVTSVTSITQDGTALTDRVDFRIDGANGQLLRLSALDATRLTTWARLSYAVTFVAGYAPIPADLVDATIRMVRNRWNAKDRDPSLMSENIPGVRDARWWIATGNEAGNMPPDIVDLISNYRVPTIA